MALAPAGRRRPLRERQSGQGEVAADRIDRRQHGHRVHDPVRSGGGEVELQPPLAQPRHHRRAAARQRIGLQRAHVGVLRPAEGDDPRRAGGRLQDAALRAVGGHDGDAARLQPLEDLALGARDVVDRGEELLMRGRDGGDERHMTAAPAG